MEFFVCSIILVSAVSVPGNWARDDRECRGDTCLFGCVNLRTWIRCLLGLFDFVSMLCCSGLFVCFLSVWEKGKRTPGENRSVFDCLSETAFGTVVLTMCVKLVVSYFWILSFVFRVRMCQRRFRAEKLMIKRC